MLSYIKNITTSSNIIINYYKLVNLLTKANRYYDINMRGIIEFCTRVVDCLQLLKIL